MTDLIARLTAATGPDVELDAAIEMAINPDGAVKTYHHILARRINGDWEPLPRYAGTFEDALKAVPNGYRLAFSGQDGFGWSAVIETVASPKKVFGLGSRAASAPMAICIAAMKARGL